MFLIKILQYNKMLSQTAHKRDKKDATVRRVFCLVKHWINFVWTWVGCRDWKVHHCIWKSLRIVEALQCGVAWKMYWRCAFDRFSFVDTLFISTIESVSAQRLLNPSPKSIKMKKITLPSPEPVFCGFSCQIFVQKSLINFTHWPLKILCRSPASFSCHQTPARNIAKWRSGTFIFSMYNFHAKKWHLFRAPTFHRFPIQCPHSTLYNTLHAHCKCSWWAAISKSQ